MFFDFLIKKTECQHTRVPIDVDEAYCPDCGELIKNQWFLVRCACCNIKRTAHTKYDKIEPDTKFCRNCGSTEFYIEELEKVNFTDVHYAIFKQVIIPQFRQSTRQIWIEKDNSQLEERKLIGFRK